MKRIVLGLIVLALIALPLTAQDGESSEEDVSNAEVVAVLEEINEKLDRVAPAVREENEVEFGGSPYIAGRYLLDMQKMRDYVDGLGDYGITRSGDDPEGFSDFMLPFVDGGGGTWRWTGPGNFSVGLEYYGYGQSLLGQRTHLPDSGDTADRANTTIDEDGDGLDDYYTYAGYGYSSFNVLARYAFSLGETVFVGIGGKAGMGGDSFSISQNERSVIDTTLALNRSVESDIFAWSRSLLTAGAFGGLQWKPEGEDGVFGMILDAGFDYHYPIADWAPQAGVHVGETAPPEDFTPMNAWVTIGPSFNY
jgi:hypothetical protein